MPISRRRCSATSPNAANRGSPSKLIAIAKSDPERGSAGNGAEASRRDVRRGADDSADRDLRRFEQRRTRRKRSSATSASAATRRRAAKLLAIAKGDARQRPARGGDPADREVTERRDRRAAEIWWCPLRSPRPLRSMPPAVLGSASMARVTGIGGVFFKARDADALRDWYRTHLGLDIQPWGGVAFNWRDGETSRPRRLDGVDHLPCLVRLLRTGRQAVHDQLPGGRSRSCVAGAAGRRVRRRGQDRRIRVRQVRLGARSGGQSRRALGTAAGKICLSNVREQEIRRSRGTTCSPDRLGLHVTTLCRSCGSYVRAQKPRRRAVSSFAPAGFSFASPPAMFCTCSCVSVRFDAFAAAKMRSTISSVAGRPAALQPEDHVRPARHRPDLDLLLPADEARRHRRIHRVHQRAVSLPERLDHRRGVDAGGGAERVGADHRIVRRDRARRTRARPPARRPAAPIRSLLRYPIITRLTISRSIDVLPHRSPMPSAAPCSRVAPASSAAMLEATPKPRSRWPCQSMPTSTPSSAISDLHERHHRPRPVRRRVADRVGDAQPLRAGANRRREQRAAATRDRRASCPR